MKPTDAIDFWTASDLTEAKFKIYDESDGKTWDGQTRDVLPILLNDTVRGVLAELPGPHVALEIGCGVGRLLKALSGEFGRVIGIDMTPKMLEHSREYLAGTENVRTQLCDGETIPVSDETVDFVYSMITFQHIPTHAAVESYLRETRRILKPGGAARIQTYRGHSRETPTPIEGCYYPSARAFAQAFECAGLKVLEEQEGIWHENHIWVTGQKQERE